MKIGYDAKRAFHNRSGLGNYSRDLIRMMAAYFPENEYWLYTPKEGEKGFLNSLAGKLTVNTPNGIFKSFLSSLWRRKFIVGQLKKDGLDIYHGLSNELPLGIGETGIKSIVSIHDMIFFRHPDWYSKADAIIHQKKTQQAVREATAIVAISLQTKNDMLEFLHFDKNKLQVIYQGCHAAFKKDYSQKELEKTRKKYQLPKKYLLSVGTIEERKNLLTVVKSMLHHSFPLVVVGKKTNYFAKVEGFINEHKLQERVVFLSDISMEELAQVYRMAFAFCYVSIYEGFGIPIIEALYSKVPVITNKEGVFAETGGPGSLYIDAQNEKELAQQILSLEDTAQYNQIIETGYNFVQKFNDETIAKQWHETYQQVLKTK